MPPIDRPKHKGKALVAGATVGIFEICCTYPIEFTKTVLQLSTKKVSALQIVTSTYQSFGPLGFYRGLPSMLYFAGPKAAIRFSSFETCSGYLSPPGNPDLYNLGMAKGFIAGMGAGTMEAIFISTPMETMKVRLINDAFRASGEQAKYKSFYHGVRTIVGEQGVAGIYKGLLLTIMEVATTKGTQFGLFNCIPPEKRDTPIKAALSGAFAGGVSVLVFNGIEIVKARMQSLEAHKYRSTGHCVSEIFTKEGPLAFYKGVGPRLTRVCCEVGITMSLYSEVVKMLDKVWKTDH